MPNRLGERQTLEPGHAAQLVHRRRRLLTSSYVEDAAIIDVSMSGMLVRRTVSKPVLAVGTTIRVDIAGHANMMRIARVERRQDIEDVGLVYARLHHEAERILQGLAAGSRESKDWYWELNR